MSPTMSSRLPEPVAAGMLTIVGGSLDIACENGTIIAIGADACGVSSRTVLDASGCRVLPGFIDVQVNGAAGVDLTTDPAGIDTVAAFLPRSGITSFLPTIISSGAEHTLECLDVLTAAPTSAPG